ncbi:hypothetical protein LH128_05183 [Sphingomonas sp. LH128]|uniref:hypothetical protein n=1 Tax=Sphingomonas sp. LH128 TaxID=473781 RepID=UPI00027C9B18|nr:hypothetical protein [Sphingomonas sp. LH128]EJU14125.1 hypothetical protein LH128_05183 [Sphingomonas sp. LH128]
MEGHNSGLPPLEEPCTDCNGTGKYRKKDPYEFAPSLHCLTCKGHKVAATEAGKQIIDFISRRFQINDKEVQRRMFGD